MVARTAASSLNNRFLMYEPPEGARPRVCDVHNSILLLSESKEGDETKLSGEWTNYGCS